MNSGSILDGLNFKQSMKININFVNSNLYHVDFRFIFFQPQNNFPDVVISMILGGKHIEYNRNPVNKVM